jgi:hypothetical protein
MRRSIEITLALLALSACTARPPKKEVAEADQKIEIKKIIAPPEEATSYQLSNTEPRKWLEDYRFGKFFNDRAEFFVIHNPKSRIFDSGVSKIILYYLDGNHCQSRFVLAENIAAKMIKQYGTFQITPLDETNKRILENEAVLITNNGYRQINPALTRYELLWKFPTKFIRLRIDAENTYEPYVYSEHVPDYKNIFQEIELATH